MSTTAIVMMVAAMVLVWGGLLLALINIRRSPEEADELDTPAEGERRESGAGEHATVGETRDGSFGSSSSDGARETGVPHQAGADRAVRSGHGDGSQRQTAPARDQEPGSRF